MDIKQEYRWEIMQIENKLRQLESRRIYEITGYKGDGYIYNNIQQLRSDIYDLLERIENGTESRGKELGRKLNEVSSIYDFKIEDND